MPRGKNVIWCAAFQAAWDRLKDDLAGEPVRVAHAEAIAEKLNRESIPAGTLPEGSSYAAAGFVELKSEAKLVPKCVDPYYLFNQPFLIVVKKRDAKKPFFVMWVDNAKLLSRPLLPGN